VKIAPSLSREESNRRRFWRSRWEGPGSAGYQHYGRLAGFTNRKDEHGRTGRYPWVKVVEATGQAAGDAKRALLDRQEAERIAREHEEAKQYRSALNQERRPPTSWTGRPRGSCAA